MRERQFYFKMYIACDNILRREPPPEGFYLYSIHSGHCAIIQLGLFQKKNMLEVTG